MNLLGLTLISGILAIASCSPASAFSEDESQKGWNALGELFSQPSAPTNWNRCDITSVMDYDKYLLKIPDIRDAWLYKDNSTEFYQKHGHRILYIIGRKFATTLTQAVYGNENSPKPSSCRFRLMISDQDQFGNDRPYVLLSWSFTRELASKTHWDKLDDKKFPYLAIDFKWGEEFVTRANQDPPF